MPLTIPHDFFCRLPIFVLLRLQTISQINLNVYQLASTPGHKTTGNQLCCKATKVPSQFLKNWQSITFKTLLRFDFEVCNFKLH